MIIPLELNQIFYLVNSEHLFTYETVKMALNNLFLDFNSYFASVEQQVRPELRGKPVAVAPVMTDSTCCIAASYEAKAFGIKTGTSIRDAKRMCPSLKIVEAQHKVYLQYHNQLVAAVDSCIPVEKVISIDEMVCNLLGKQKQKEEAIKLALHIKDTISRKVGKYLRSSIGLAPNSFLAKTGTDMQKPDGLVVIEEKDLPEILYKLKPNDLCGIGRRMNKRLLYYGIDTIEKLFALDKKMMKRMWRGIEGERMYDQLRGKIVYRPITHRSTVGHSHVLSPKFRNTEGSYAVLNRLLQKAAMRMRYLGYVTGCMFVKVKYVDGERWKDALRFPHTQSTRNLLRYLDEMWSKNTFIYQRPIAVAVSLFKLIEEEKHTPTLFENYDKSKSLHTAIDSLNKRYGNHSIYYCGSHYALDSAPMRIAFTQIPNLDIEDD